MAHTNQFKQFTVRAPYEDGGYATLSYLVFDDSNLLGKSLIGATNSIIPLVSGRATEVNITLKTLGIDTNKFIMGESFYYDSSLYPNWTQTLQQETKIDRMAELFPMTAAPNINVIYDKVIKINKQLVEEAKDNY